MQTALWNILFFFVVIAILITIHEFGHFYVARRCGVKVLRFSIGFGPVVWRRIGRDGTEYAISLIPLGGYVKMKGESADEPEADSRDARANGSSNSFETDFAEIRTGEYSDSDSSSANVSANFSSTESSSAGSAEDPDSFAAQSVGKRALIVAAGPLANLFLTVILFFICHLVGIRTILPAVGHVYPDTAAATAQLQEYDLIKSVDGSPVENWSDVLSKFMLDLGESTTLEVRGDLGTGATRELQLSLHGVEVAPDRDVFVQLGIEPCVGRVTNVISAVLDNSPAQRVGLQADDQIVAVNGNPVSDWYDVTSAMKAVNDPEMVVAGNVAVQSVSLSILRAGSPLEMSVTPELISVGSYSSEKRLMIGMVAKVEPIPELEHTVQYGPVDAMIKSLALTGETSLVLLNAFKDMIIGALSVKNLSGPIAIAEVAGASASWGVIPFLWFLATISINLAVFNLIPIPVLDGGQLLYCLYEKLAGHKPSARVQFYLTAFGLSILLSLTFLAIFNDLMRVL